MSRVRDSIVLVGFAMVLIGSSGPAHANEPWQDALPAPSAPQSPPAVPSEGPSAGLVRIDQLLKLPASYRVEDARKGGGTRAQWRDRFVDARANLAEQEKNLARVRAELEKNAGNATQWQMAPPGADLSNSENPVSFRLTQELRRGREEVKRAEQRITELDIEANLAGVPEDWRL